jgi:NitT/TauT family transport system permease protein
LSSITASTAPQLTAAKERRRLSWVDGLVLLLLFSLLWSVLHFGRGMFVSFDPASMAQLDSSPRQIPYYAGRTLLRMWVAFCFSLLFAVGTGYLAAKNAKARAFILPTLDVLQSVPVLGFLSITVTGFMALFPGNLLGLECASVFAIFTGQVWNMAFGFYHSMITIPTDMQEAASTYGLTPWQRFRTVELPASAHSLIWNSMMSFGGGWFFVAQSEAISVMNKDMKLPGLGSYMAQSIVQGDNRAAFYAVAAMIALILLSDQLVWRPLLAWADRFKVESTGSTTPATSWFYQLLRRANVLAWLSERLLRHTAAISTRVTRPLSLTSLRIKIRHGKSLWATLLLLLSAWALYQILTGLVGALLALSGALTLPIFGHVVWLGFLTFLRVAAMTVVATLLWTPVGVWIGSRPRVARFAQPLAQIGASFPVNMTFPIVVGWFVASHITLNWGSILLIAMGTQWYILFNVIAGAMAIPNDLQEAARVCRLRRWDRWRTLILPAIFPYWVTGACTAAGGAWNASIVAELATWGDTTLKADGLGAYIATVTRSGDAPMILTSIAVMTIFVVSTNKLIWRRLYAFAERRFRLD